MELSKWLKGEDIDNFPNMGKESFNTFLKICLEFSNWALDDIGLANRANAYKIWVCKVQSEDLSKVKNIIERYSSMKKLLHYYNKNIVENNFIAFYIKLNWIQNKWMMSYGITDNKDLYKIGEFEYNISTVLPQQQILKYINDTIGDFNPREHLTLFKIKQDMFSFNPGYCQITDPQIINKEIILSTYNLGIWTDNGLQNGEGDKYMEVFKDWVRTQVWFNLVYLIVKPKNDKWMDFKITLK